MEAWKSGGIGDRLPSREYQLKASGNGIMNQKNEKYFRKPGVKGAQGQIMIGLVSTNYEFEAYPESW